jgi:hypothetical protein
MTAKLKRRAFITLLGSAAAWPLAARAQEAGQRLIGALIGPAQSDPAARSWFAAFQDALAKLGWREGAMRTAPSNVRFLGYSGREMLAVRLSHFDPKRR